EAKLGKPRNADLRTPTCLTGSGADALMAPCVRQAPTMDWRLFLASVYWQRKPRFCVNEFRARYSRCAQHCRTVSNAGAGAAATARRHHATKRIADVAKARN